MADKIIPGIQVLSYGVPIEAPPGDEWVAVLRSKLPKRDEIAEWDRYRAALAQIWELHPSDKLSDYDSNSPYYSYDVGFEMALLKDAQIAHAALHPGPQKEGE